MDEGSKQDTLSKEAIREHLGDSFYDIRFGRMTMEELSNIFNTYPMTVVFTAEEHKDIVQMITTKKKKSKFLNGNPRESGWDQAPLITLSRRYEDESEKPSLSNNSDITTFSTNKTLLLR